MKFDYLNPGDRVLRSFAGAGMEMIVRSKQESTIICDALQADGSIFPGEWTFDLTTGAEVDEDLGWGPQFGITGSFLIKEEDSK